MNNIDSSSSPVKWKTRKEGTDGAVKSISKSIRSKGRRLRKWGALRTSAGPTLYFWLLGESHADSLIPEASPSLLYTYSLPQRFPDGFQFSECPLLQTLERNNSKRLHLSKGLLSKHWDIMEHFFPSSCVFYVSQWARNLFPVPAWSAASSPFLPFF